MRRLLTGFIIAIVSVAAAPRASAQSISDLKTSVALLQAQVDQLQKALNTQIGDPLMATYLDATNVVEDPIIGTTVSVWGWGLRCGDEKVQPLAYVAIDGVLAQNVSLARFQRPDVTAVYFNLCRPYGGLIQDVGVAFAIDLSNYAVGPHTIQLRLRDYRGAVVQSNVLTVRRP